MCADDGGGGPTTRARWAGATGAGAAETTTTSTPRRRAGRENGRRDDVGSARRRTTCASSRIRATAIKNTTPSCVTAPVSRRGWWLLSHRHHLLSFTHTPRQFRFRSGFSRRILGSSPLPPGAALRLTDHARTLLVAAHQRDRDACICDHLPHKEKNKKKKTSSWKS